MTDLITPRAHTIQTDARSITLDVIDHSEGVTALQQAFANAASSLSALLEGDEAVSQESTLLAGQAVSARSLSVVTFVELSMRELLLHYCDFTATDFRLVGWSGDDRAPRAWGCYRITHTPSQQWLEIVVSHVQSTHPPGDGKMLLNSIALLLDGVLYGLDRSDWGLAADVSDAATRPGRSTAPSHDCTSTQQDPANRPANGPAVATRHIAFKECSSSQRRSGRIAPSAA